MFLGLIGFAVLANGCTHKKTESQTAYPKHWWQSVPSQELKSWEISPDQAKPGEVILSKRNELGLLSNFAATPFTFRGNRYASLEGFWQSMKYPESENDVRSKNLSKDWKFDRRQVAKMVAFEAKRAGDLGSENMKELGIDWVTFEGQKITYRDPQKGMHYRLIYQATVEKLKQNPQVMKVLMATRGLTLKPDHHQKPDAPPAWKYYEILQEIRDKDAEIN
ncbi:MAG: hypothetical protein KDD61_07010 [Bdellovibrionales bacterium]|nr:hypothetical protein [Bdellovibrionales bacterium]